MIKFYQHAPHKLVQALEDNYKLEKGKYMEFKEGQEFLKDSSFTSTNTKLTKTMHDKTIEVNYQPAKVTSIDNKEQSRAEFTVTVKDKNGCGVLFVCSTENTIMTIHSIAYSKNIEKRVFKLFEFSKFSGEVQKAFINYLEFLGITKKMVAYIECEAIDKDQIQCMNWLKSIKDFLI